MKLTKVFKSRPVSLLHIYNKLKNFHNLMHMYIKQVIKHTMSLSYPIEIEFFQEIIADVYQSYIQEIHRGYID